MDTNIAFRIFKNKISKKENKCRTFPILFNFMTFDYKISIKDTLTTEKKEEEKH